MFIFPPATDPNPRNASESSKSCALRGHGVGAWREQRNRKIALIVRRRMALQCRADVFYRDLDAGNDFWLVRDYLPEIATSNVRSYPSMTRLVDALPAAIVQPLLVPRDCTDRMFAALWARPEQYLDPRVRAGTSTWDKIPDEAAARALEQLRRDLASGAWDERYGHLRSTPAWDVGLRLIRADLRAR